MQNRSCPWRRFWFAIALCILTCPPARAHSIFQAALLLDYHANSVDVELQLPASRLEKVFGHELTASTLPALQPELSQYLLARMHAQSLNGSTWTVRLSAPRLGAHRRSSLHRCFFPAAALATKFLRHFVLTDDVITDTVPSQSMLVSIRSNWSGSTFANEPELMA